MSDLPSLMMDLFYRAGMPADAVDVSALQERIGGVVLSQRQSVRTVLDHLQTLFQFDVVEHDRTLVFAPRGPRSARRGRPSSTSPRCRCAASCGPTAGYRSPRTSPISWRSSAAPTDRRPRVGYHPFGATRG